MPLGRADPVRRVVEDGETPKAGAVAFGVCDKTVRKRVDRVLADGPAAAPAL